MEYIKVRGAKEHNLQNIDIDIPKYKFVVFTGPSGSGKSSLAMDTIYAEGQRRYVESLSSYARQFLGVMDKPDVETIEGLSPAIAIDQKTTSHNPRSTVGTITEIYDYFRLLFARVGHPHCPKCGDEISTMSVEQIVNSILGNIENIVDTKKIVKGYLLAPVVVAKKGEYSKVFENLSKQGFIRARVDGKIYNDISGLSLFKTNKHDIDVIVERFLINKKTDLKELRTRLTQSVETGLALTGNAIKFTEILDEGLDFPDSPEMFNDTLYSEKFACPKCGISIAELEPRLFSFNSPQGACLTCTGIGTQLKVDIDSLMNPNLSVAEGGIFPWTDLMDKESWFKRLVTAVAETEKINLYTPIRNLKKEKLDILFFGSGSLTYKVTGLNRFGKEVSFDETFEGLINNLDRRYKETDSDYIRKDIEKYMVKEPCPVCIGARLNQQALSVTIDKQSIAETTNLSIHKLYMWCYTLLDNAINSDDLSDDYIFEKGNTVLSEKEIVIATPILKEIGARLRFLIDVGLDYLTLDRTSSTLAGGEAQRIRLASQIGSGLSGVLYVLDEPSIGLHARDHKRLIATLIKLRDLGNTVLVVEHDDQTMLSSDYIFDFGPKAGSNGGFVIAEGTVEEIIKNPKSITGQYLCGKKKIKPIVYLEDHEKADLKKKDDLFGKKLKIIGASEHNLKNIDVEIPLNQFIVVTGVSGSGKSTLINETLLKALKRSKGLKIDSKIAKHTSVLGESHIDKVIDIDQNPIGRTPRSNPVTYTGAFDYIRAIFASTEDAKLRGYKVGRFSFNVKGGRCEVCQGEGQMRIEMQFMPDIYVDCEVCKGKRYTSEVLEIDYRDKNIADILDMTVDDALGFFTNIPVLHRKLRTLSDVGLGYIKLGQPATTLSGGEAQRVKLASELSKKGVGHTLYILDEPTTGLHFSDLERLISILKRLVAKGNTVIVIEHNLEVIKNSDYIIDLGPEGGDRGGEVVFEGTPDQILISEKSHTGKALRLQGKR
ncbi:MAG: excinuclease ABC subunit UvrA [bacterium]|nr:excinuclease ABC subunit UvrA [bacterium]